MSLIVRPINATLQKGRQHLFFKRDPYVICQVGNQIYQTLPHKNGGKNPSWNDAFTFKDLSNTLRITLCDDDKISKDDIVGQGTFDLTPAYQNPYISDTRYIDMYKDGKIVGRVQVEIEYQGNTMSNNTNMNYNTNNNMYNSGYSNNNMGYNNNMNMNKQNLYNSTYSNVTGYDINTNNSKMNPPIPPTIIPFPVVMNPVQPSSNNYNNNNYNMNNMNMNTLPMKQTTTNIDLSTLGRSHLSPSRSHLSPSRSHLSPSRILNHSSSRQNIRNSRYLGSSIYTDIQPISRITRTSRSPVTIHRSIVSASPSKVTVLGPVTSNNGYYTETTTTTITPGYTQVTYR